MHIALRPFDDLVVPPDNVLKSVLFGWELFADAHLCARSIAALFWVGGESSVLSRVPETGRWLFIEERHCPEHFLEPDLREPS